jgi:hypothetical protein
MLWKFRWIGGGEDTVAGETLREAIDSAVRLGMRLSLREPPLTPDVATFQCKVRTNMIG